MSQHDFPLSHKLDRIIHSVEMSLSLMASSISTNLPVCDSMLRSAVDMLTSEVKKAQDEFRSHALDGRGPRAAALRIISELFPEKNIEEHIQARLPKVYPITDTEAREVDKYFGHTLNRVWKTQGFSEMSWLHLMTPDQLGESYKGEYELENLTLDQLVTGFYKFKTRDWSSWRTSWNVVIRIEGVVAIFSPGNPAVFHIYVSVEDQWVQTHDYKYLHVGDLLAAYDKLLKDAGLFQEKPVLLEHLVEEMITKLTEAKIYPLTPEGEKAFKEREPGRNHGFKTDGAQIAWTITEHNKTFDLIPSEKNNLEEPYSKNVVIYFKCYNEILQIGRFQTGDKTRYLYQSHHGNLEKIFQDWRNSRGFDSYPLLVRKHIRDCYLEAFDDLIAKIAEASKIQYASLPQPPPFLDPETQP